MSIEISEATSVATLTLEYLKCFGQWLNSPPKIWVLLLFIVLFAGPEKVRKLRKDYQRFWRRRYLELVKKGFCKPKVPILLVEGDPPDSWNLYTPNPSGSEEDHRWFWATSSAISSHVSQSTIYDIWVNHESLRERERYERVYWRFVQIEHHNSSGRYLFEADETLTEIKISKT